MYVHIDFNTAHPGFTNLKNQLSFVKIVSLTFFITERRE